MIAPKLRFKEFKESWLEKSVLEFAPLQRGFDLPISKMTDGEFPVVFSNGILKRHKEFKVLGPGVVTGRSGTIGKVTYVEENYWPHNTSLWVTDFKNNFPKFVYYFYINFDLAKYSAGGGVPTLNRNDVHRQKIFTPKIEEQTKIANFLSAVDQKIIQLTEKLELLNQYKNGVMHKIFSRELRFKDEDGTEFPEWHIKSIEEMENNKILELGRGNVISKTDINKAEGRYPIYSSSVKNNGLFGHYGLFMFDEELITWSIDGGGDFFYRNKHRFSVTNVSGYLRVKSDEINCKFLYYQLTEMHKKLSFDYQTKAHPSVIRTLYFVEIPSLYEQTKIANFLTAIDEKITSTQSQLELIKQYKQGLLQQMFV